jgi:hypothetical protein
LAISLTTEEFNRVIDLIANSDDEEAGLQFTIDGIQEDIDQNTLDDGIYFEFAEDARDELVTLLIAERDAFDTASPTLAPHNALLNLSSGSGDFPIDGTGGKHDAWDPSAPDFSVADYADWDIWRGPNGTTIDVQYTAAPVGFGNVAGTYFDLSPGGPANGGVVGDSIVKTVPSAGPFLFGAVSASIETIGGHPFPVGSLIHTAGDVTGSWTGGGGDTYVIVDTSGFGKPSAGNAIIVFSKQGAISYNPTADVDIENFVNRGNTFADQRFNEKTGTSSGLFFAGDNKAFMEDLLAGVIDRNNELAEEFGTP